MRQPHNWRKTREPDLAVRIVLCHRLETIGGMLVPAGETVLASQEYPDVEKSGRSLGREADLGFPSLLENDRR